MTKLEYIKKLIDEDRQSIEHALLWNRVKDIEQYRHLTGVLQGLDLAMDAVKLALDSREDDDSEN